jgi:hypothetical protein
MGTIIPNGILKWDENEQVEACEIWGFNGGEDCHDDLLGFGAV